MRRGRKAGQSTTWARTAGELSACLRQFRMWPCNCAAKPSGHPWEREPRVTSGWKRLGAERSVSCWKAQSESRESLSTTGVRCSEFAPTLPAWCHQSHSDAAPESHTTRLRSPLTTNCRRTKLLSFNDLESCSTITGLTTRSFSSLSLNYL